MFLHIRVFTQNGIFGCFDLIDVSCIRTEFIDDVVCLLFIRAIWVSNEGDVIMMEQQISVSTLNNL